MLIERSIKKAIVPLFFVLYIGCGFMFVPDSDAGASGTLGVAFLFGIVALLLGYKITRDFKKVPIVCELTGEYLMLQYYRNPADVMIRYNKITGIVLKIHSAKSAVVEICYLNDNQKTEKIMLGKMAWKGLIDFYDNLICKVDSSCDILVLKAIDTDCNTLVKFDENENWRDIFNIKKSAGMVFKEILGESIIKKVLKLTGFLILLFVRAKVGKNGMGLNIFLWFIGVSYVYYLIVAFILRLKGYSGKDSLPLVVSWTVSVFFLLGATSFYIMKILGVSYS